MSLPIDPELLIKRAEIPKLISELSYQDEAKAVEYLRVWGEKRMAITIIHSELTAALKRTSEIA